MFTRIQSFRPLEDHSTLYATLKVVFVSNCNGITSPFFVDIDNFDTFINIAIGHPLVSCLILEENHRIDHHVLRLQRCRSAI